MEPKPWRPSSPTLGRRTRRDASVRSSDEGVLRFNCPDPYVLAEFEAAAHGVDVTRAIHASSVPQLWRWRGAAVVIHCKPWPASQMWCNGRALRVRRSLPSATGPLCADPPDLGAAAPGPSAAHGLTFSAHGWLGLVCVIRELDEELRKLIKYTDRNELQPARDLLWEAIRDRGCEHVVELW